MRGAAVVAVALAARSAPAHAGDPPAEEPSVTDLTPSAARPTAPPPEPSVDVSTPSGIQQLAPQSPPPQPVQRGPQPQPAPQSSSTLLQARPEPERPAGPTRTAHVAPSVQNSRGAPSEGGIGVSQVLLGTLATFGTGIVVALVASKANSVPLAYLGIGATPAVGGLVVCGIGKTSARYEGGCAPTIGAGYLGAILLGITMAYVGADTLAPSISDGGSDRTVGAILGAALGVVVGTAVGATIGWHLSKRPRGEPSLAFGPPPPPPAQAQAWSDAWSDSRSDARARPGAARAQTAVGVPLLSLRF